MTIFSRDPVTKVTKRVHYDPIEEQMVVGTEQDVTGVVEANKRSYNSFDHSSARHAANGDMVASIPSVIWADLVAQGIAYDEDRLRKWLDDPDNRVFRTRPGKLGKKRSVR